ncbi:head GIN domain-containing protein [Aurantiacibacter poecillastricola]|uniref:head GIN domain-containing protein n=1 Tax=Aurantiacibacter poecillastricola TaxID=3064385 RepID=UPI00273D6A8E|nr:head GIN domain-containing protein [Aurantiacibacter sp. 219JJ12-13]MDP5260490.1 head GIN domain-containing protein [Aurantiacibacter sp. 219JJ12-13]
MRIGTLLRRIAPVVAISAAAGLAACDNVNVEFESDGVPLAELDMSAAPTEVALASPDTVIITAGEDFAIYVEGSAAARDRMRFALDGDTLGIHRSEGDWSSSDSATVNITMPPPGALIMAGSGTMRTNALSEDASIVLAGSGEVTASGIAANKLEVVNGGSGTVNLSGRTDTLELNVAGSGAANMESLVVGDAEVTLAGSGLTSFASDGNVDATIMGSGTVRVNGSANCTVNSMGSGSLVCESGAAAAEDADEPA